MTQRREGRVETARLPGGDPVCALVVAGGVAPALTKTGAQGDDVLKGTEEPDLFDGRAVDDKIVVGGENSSPSFLK